MKFLIYIIVILTSLSLNSQIVINEYSCSNLNDYVDNYGEFEDWVELYNSGSTEVDLTGYYLSDKINTPLKWQIPSGTITAGEYMMVFASGRGEVSGGNLHTSFKLTQTKYEYILLSNPSGALVDNVQLNPALLSHSRGRVIDGDVSWGVMSNPTPNASNNNVSNDYAPKPQIDIEAGAYSTGQVITITCSSANVEIRYTLDGSEPTSTSIVYSNPLNISTTTVVRVKAFSTDANYLDSFIETNTYFINEGHSLKIISISGDDMMLLLNGGWDENPVGSFEYFTEGGVFSDEGVGNYDKHGNDSWAYDQRGIDYVARDQFGYNYTVDAPIFRDKSRSKYQKLIIKAAANDNISFEDGAHIRDAYVHSLSHKGDLKMDERTYEPCIMYANGQYWGVYELREKVDDHDFTDYYYDQNANNLDFIKTWGGTWAEYGDMTDWADLYNYIISNDLSVDANYQNVIDRFNHKSLVDYISLNSYTVCSDWLNWNTAWWRGKNPSGDKKKYRYALWDMDATFGHYINYTGIPDVSPVADLCDPEGLDAMSDPEGHMVIFNKLMENEQFRQYYISRWIDLSNDIFSCDQMISHLDSLVGIIAPEMERQTDRWGGSYQQWEDNVQVMRDFINTRCAAFATSMEDCYDVEGPYNMLYDVSPANSGTLQINSINPDNYGYTGDYYSGVDILLDATPNTNYFFDHWELNNHALSPDEYTAESVLAISSTDTVIAFFVLDSIDLTLMVEPINSGNILMNGVTNDNYPTTSGYEMNYLLNSVAVPNTGYEFSHWSSLHHSFNPDSMSESMSFDLLEIDTLVAHFEELDETYSFPDVFTPNGDGLNDFLVPNHNEGLDIATWYVYDRWGALLHKANYINDAWDGLREGKPVIQGTYYYVINFESSAGELISDNGFFTLVR